VQNDTKGFIESYMAYTSGQESPADFHYWTAVSALSSAVGRNIWLDRGYYKIYPNHYIILVAGSALSRKSSAINIGVRILRKALERLKEAGIDAGALSVLSAKMTPEALCRAMSTKGIKSMYANEEEEDEENKISRPLLLYSSELGVFLSRTAQMNGLVDLLIDFYDCPDDWEYLTKTQGADFVHNVYTAMLSATTPDWISANITGSVFNQGLVGRTIFVHSDKAQTRVAHPQFNEYEQFLENRLLDLLESKLLLKGEMTLTQEAYEYYEQWYNLRADPGDNQSMQSGFFGREHDHVLKLSMAISMSRSNDLIITFEDIQNAIEKVGTVRVGLGRVFREVKQQNEIFEVQYVESIIKDKGKISHSDLLRLVRRKMNSGQLKEAITVLTQSEIITTVSEKPKRGPAKKLYTFVKTV
tara:strand:+ start:3073 stop:4317 length:1245 start_codon:yes stop_codon:yes gene_type:complete